MSHWWFVALDERADDVEGLVERMEPMEPEALFLRRADEAFDHAGALRLADEGRDVGDAKPSELAATRTGDILRCGPQSELFVSGAVFGFTPEGRLRSSPSTTSIVESRIVKPDTCKSYKRIPFPSSAGTIEASKSTRSSNLGFGKRDEVDGRGG